MILLLLSLWLPASAAQEVNCVPDPTAPPGSLELFCEDTTAALQPLIGDRGPIIERIRAGIYPPCHYEGGAPPFRKRADIPDVAIASLEPLLPAGKPVTLINPDVIGKANDVSVVFFFAHECEHHKMGHPREALLYHGGHSAKPQEREADCAAAKTLALSGLLRPEDAEDLQFSAGDEGHDSAKVRRALVAHCARQALKARAKAAVSEDEGETPSAPVPAPAPPKKKVPSRPAGPGPVVPATAPPGAVEASASKVVSVASVQKLPGDVRRASILFNARLDETTSSVTSAVARFNARNRATSFSYDTCRSYVGKTVKHGGVAYKVKDADVHQPREATTPECKLLGKDDWSICHAVDAKYQVECVVTY